MPPVISIVGASDVGKTTLIEKLIPELKKRGYRIGVIKHAHRGFTVDQQGKDSWRHKAAGADAVMVASNGRIALLKDEPGHTLEGLEKYFGDLDLVITEGYKHADKPKIEVLRKAVSRIPVCRNTDQLMAVVTDADVTVAVPTFGLEDIEPLADLIEKRFPKEERPCAKD